MAQTVVVLGARNLGGAIIDHFLGLGWNAAGVARGDETIQRVRDRGALGAPGSVGRRAAATRACSAASRA